MPPGPVSRATTLLWLCRCGMLWPIQCGVLIVNSPTASQVKARFGSFEMDLRAGELRKHGVRIRLQTQPFQILGMLLRRPGEVVTREELRQALWPDDTFVDFDHGLNNAINRLREALGDSAETPRYIETLPKRGYRFIASVGDREGMPPSQTMSRRRVWFLTAMGMLPMAAVAYVGWLISRQIAPQKIMKQHQLTANVSENAVLNGAISPDGNYLAFSDRKGIYLKLIATGDVRAIPPPVGFKYNTAVEWYIGPWFPDGTRFLANMQVDQRCRIWVVPLLGEMPHKIRDDAWARAVSPDGLRIAFTRNHPASVASGEAAFPNEEIWLMSSNGEHPQEFLSATDRRDAFYDVQWSPDGKRLAYDFAQQNDEQDKLEQVIQTRDLNSQSLTAVLSNPQLQDFRWLADGRIIYSLAEEDTTSDNLWEIRVDTSTGAARGQPRQLSNWAGFHIGSLSATADAKHMAFLKFSSFHSVYVGEFDKSRATLKPPRRLTFTEAIDMPTDWTPDGKAVIFGSNRTGHWSIFKQALDQDFAETIIPGKEGGQAGGPHLSPDGKWIVYSEYQNIQPGHQSLTSLQRIMRVPLAGGPPEFIFSSGSYNGIRCSRAPADFCILAEEAPGGRELIFSTFDPIKGRGRELARLPKDPKIEFHWNLSPDGKRIANLVPGAPAIHLLSLDGKPPREITVKGWPVFNTLDFSADSTGFFVSSMTNGGGTLLYVDFNGKAHPLWQQRSARFAWGVPSWDGRRLAILGPTPNGNLWMLENF
jgi:Tol biopolymer transport system component/DNA-binding winged helix-turn-helix (wHTH) protein